MSTPLSPAEIDEIGAALEAMGLTARGEVFAAARLSGGVSCDVYRVDLPAGTLCLKRALPKLRVAADWRAPADRSASEVAWMRLAHGIVPGAVPDILAEDPSRHIFAMEFFPPEDYPVWKAELAAGRIAPDFAAEVGGTLARLHAATAGSEDIASAFANDAQFRALRLDPFLLYVAARHDEIAGTLRALSDRVARARIALMQGDISPKNILCGPKGPVFLDAETACYGDPAFDLAFCLNHLLLKCVWHPAWRTGYLDCFAALAAAYRAGIDWEAPDALDGRTAELLPALALARVDGKSPAEYLTQERQKSFVRDTAVSLLKDPAADLKTVSRRWASALAAEFS